MLKKLCYISVIFILAVAFIGCGDDIPNVAGTYVGTATNVTVANTGFAASASPNKGTDTYAYRVVITQDGENIQCTHTWVTNNVVYQLSGTINESGSFSASGSETNWDTWTITETGTIIGNVYTSRINYVGQSYGADPYDLNLVK
jgi:hypothetical protein